MAAFAFTAQTELGLRPTLFFQNTHIKTVFINFINPANLLIWMWFVVIVLIVEEKKGVSVMATDTPEREGEKAILYMNLSGRPPSGEINHTAAKELLPYWALPCTI